MNIVFISGPAHHSDDIYCALQSNNTVTYLKYFPKFSRVFKGKKTTHLLFNIYSYFVWGIYHKLNLDKRIADSLIYGYYDKLCSKSITKDTDLLIAWPQVSLKSIKKARKLGIKVVLEYPMIHPEEWNVLMKQEYSKLKISKKIQRSLFTKKQLHIMNEEIKLSHHINVLSSFAYNTFVKHGTSPSQLSVNAPGIKFTEDPKNIGTGPDNKFIVLFVGRIDILKGTHYLLEAFANLPFENKELRMVGTINSEIQPIIDRFNSPDIKYLGFQNRNKLRQLYSEASVLVLPSVQESFGLVILEALNHQLPVIVSKNSGGPDIQKEASGVFTYTFNDTKKLTELLTLLHSSPQKGIVNNKKTYSLTEYYAKYEQLVKSIP